MRVLMAAVVGSIALLAAPLRRARRRAVACLEGWLDHQRSGRAATGCPTARRARSFLQRTPATPYVPGSTKDPYGFADYSLGRTLGFGRDYGLGNMQATLGVRMAEPLATNGFTPALRSAPLSRRRPARRL